MARVCDVKFQQIQKYEAGRNSPHPCALVKLAQFLKVSLDTSEKIIKNLQDPDLKAEVKAALVKAAEDKAERMTKFFNYT